MPEIVQKEAHIQVKIKRLQGSTAYFSSFYYLEPKGVSRVNASLSGILFGNETLVDLDISVGMAGRDESMLMLHANAAKLMMLLDEKMSDDEALM